VKFAFISEEKVAFPVAVLCRIMSVSPSGFYATQGRPKSPHTLRDEALSQHVAAAHVASSRRYGSPRVHAELKAAGHRVGRKRVARLMREKALVARKRRRFRTTTDSKHGFPIAPNVLARETSAPAALIKCGSRTSRSCGRSRAGSTWLPSSTCSRGESLGGQPANTSTVTSRSKHWTWPSASAARREPRPSLRSR
jgi:transposase InsO family protein